MDSDATNVENIDFSIISKARVMVVDSAEENRKVIAECFEQTDVEVFHFNNPRSAIESLKEYEFDLIFMDVDLLETDDGAVSIVMAKISKAPVISLTTKGLKNIDFVSNGLKVVGHIKKPISKIELFKICIRVLNSSHLLNEKGEMTEEINLFEEANEDNARDFLKEEAQKVSSLYKLAYASNDLNQIKEFAQSLHEVAQKYKIDYFLSYSNDLLKKIELFDIDTISKMMNNYIKVLNLLKKKAK
jgi:CheY-like chemotaxis protein